MAMMAAPPRKKANGDSAMRPCRMGTRSATRDSACAASTSSGSREPARGLPSAWADRGVTVRRSRPAALRSAHESFMSVPLLRVAVLVPATVGWPRRQPTAVSAKRAGPGIVRPC